MSSLKLVQDKISGYRGAVTDPCDVPVRMAVQQHPRDHTRYPQQPSSSTHQCGFESSQSHLSCTNSRVHRFACSQITEPWHVRVIDLRLVRKVQSC